MFTQNYMKYRLLMEGWTSLTFTAPDGSTSSYPSAQYSYAYGFKNLLKFMQGALGAISSTSPSYGIHLGTGNTPATESDYELESPITSGLIITNGSVVKTDVGNGKYTITVSGIIQNNTGADINIYEIGLFGCVGYYRSSTQYYMPILCERTVLSEPITIPAGERKLVTYKITFNQILNVE